MGADEVVCEDTWHENDWTYDGIINMEDFSIFSAAWLSHDPNEPGGDPNFFAGWNPICNLDDAGDSEYAIDLADFIAFCEDSPQNWLWVACWKQSYYQTYGTYAMSGGGESMMMASPMAITESVYSAQSPQTEPVQLIYEPTPAELAENISDIQDFLSKVLKEDNPVNEKGILEMMAYLEDWLKEIKL